MNGGAEQATQDTQPESVAAVDTPAFEEAASVFLRDGSEVRLRRDPKGLEMCHKDACLSVPGTAADLLAFMEFFRGLGKNGASE